MPDTGCGRLAQIHRKGECRGVLKGSKVLLCFRDNGLRDSELTPEKEHPIDAIT